jgi:MFS transporter, SP family, arabinose:H+ symporter
MDVKVPFDGAVGPAHGGYYRVLFACAAAAFGGFLFGYDQGTFSGAQIFVRRYFQMTPLTFGCATSALMLGCLLATFGGLWIQEHLGARKCLSVAAILLTVGALCAASAPNAAALVAFRMLSGLAIGIISIASPVYITEIAPPARRGGLGLLYQLLLTIGVLTGIALGWLLAVTLAPHVVWRYLLGSTALPSLILLLLSRFIPTSPRWLLTHGREAEAMAVMQTIRETGQAAAELEAMRVGSQKPEGSFRDLLGPGIRWAILTGVLLGLFNNWTGGSGVGSYLPTLFQWGGFPIAGDALAVVLLASCVNVGFTVVSIRLVDRVGRRTLWMSTAATMTLLAAALGLVFHAGMTGPVIVILILLMVICHALGLAPIPWLMISELYSGPLRVRAVSVCTTVLWLSGFTCVLTFPPLAAWSQRWIGSIAGPFWIYAGMSLLALLFGWRLLPETRGKTLDEVARHFHSREQPEETLP